MWVSRIVKGRATHHLKGKRASHHLNGTHQVMLVSSAPHRLDGHEIDDLTHAIHSQKARDEDISIWQIELFALHTRRIRRSDAEKAPFLSIKQSPEDAGSVKTRDTAPINRAILAY